MKRYKKYMNSGFKITSDFTEFTNVFLKENSKHNLISKNDEKFLFEKHIYDSLSIKLFFEKYSVSCQELLDIGCGGGFPCIPIAIEFPQIEVTGLDSIGKKINSILEIKSELKIGNLKAVCSRAENIKGKNFDIITSRAVGELCKISQYALPLLKSGGYFIAYKSKKALQEIENSQKVLDKYGAKVIDIIDYTLPLDEIYQRNLVVIQK